jgi:hypothetical protein
MQCFAVSALAHRVTFKLPVRSSRLRALPARKHERMIFLKSTVVHSEKLVAMMDNITVQPN